MGKQRARGRRGTLIVPEIKDYFCSDIESVWEWAPSSQESVDFWLQLNIGQRGTEASDIFQVHILSEKALAIRLKKEQWFHERHAVISKNYSWEALLKHLQSMVADCADENWDDVAERLARLFKWEFEVHE